MISNKISFKRGNVSENVSKKHYGYINVFMIKERISVILSKSVVV